MSRPRLFLASKMARYVTSVALPVDLAIIEKYQGA